MKISESYIYLKDILFYAYHGVNSQETKIGNTFIINLKLKVDLTQAMQSDNLMHTVNYANVHNILAEEMNVSSKLLEHVCGRIVERIFEKFPTIDEVEIQLSKQNPPMGADIAAAGVELHCCRK